MLCALERTYIIRRSNDRLHLDGLGDRSPGLFGEVDITIGQAKRDNDLAQLEADEFVAKWSRYQL